MIDKYNVTLETPAGAFTAYLAKPADVQPTARAAVLLLPEIYNLNAWIREVADRYAERGYIALVPDLFWRHEAGVDLPYTPEGQQRGRALGAALDRSSSVEDTLAAANWLREHAQSPTVAAIGFCLGGELALLAGAAVGTEGRRGLDAAVAYYPTRMETHLDAVERLAIPSLIHLGEKDWRTPPELVRSLEQRLPAGLDHELHVYADADHGFGRFGHPPFHAPSAALAESRTQGLSLIHI